MSAISSIESGGFRIKLINETECSNWSRWINTPTAGYMEVQGIGPVLLQEIEYLEINAIEKKHIGKLVPLKEIDHSEGITNYLDQTSTSFELKQGCFRIGQSELKKLI